MTGAPLEERTKLETDHFGENLSLCLLTDIDLMGHNQSMYEQSGSGYKSIGNHGLSVQ